jgi:glycosyltransferase involved in cell wall biosynthesis
MEGKNLKNIQRYENQSYIRRKKELSVIAPMFNEAAIIEQSINKLVSVLDKLALDWELILVNDGSTDNTLEIATRVVAQRERIKIISYQKNRGRGYALRIGFQNARGKYIVTTESDMSWEPEIIERIYQKLISSDADIVIASPYHKGGKLINVPLKRAFLSKFGNIILRMSVAPKITMVSGMTRGYKGNMIRKLNLTEDDKEIHLEIVSKASILGYKFAEVPGILKWDFPKKGTAKRTSKFKALKLIKSHLLFGIHEAPIILFGSLGLMTLVSGLIIGFYLSYLFFLEGQKIGDRIILIMTTVFLILSGFQIFLFCFLSYQNRDIGKELYRMKLDMLKLLKRSANHEIDYHSIKSKVPEKHFS